MAFAWPHCRIRSCAGPRASCWRPRRRCRPSACRAACPRSSRSVPGERIRDLVNLNLPGIALRSLPVAPRQIPYHAGFLYFELDRDSELWKQTEQSGTLAMFLARESPASSSSSGPCEARRCPTIHSRGSDDDRTVIMPVARRAPGRAAPRRRRRSTGQPSDVRPVSSGLNPLVAAANPLLNVIPQICARFEHPNSVGAARQSRPGRPRVRGAGASRGGVHRDRSSPPATPCAPSSTRRRRARPGAPPAPGRSRAARDVPRRDEGGEKFFQLLARLAENPQANLRRARADVRLPAVRLRGTVSRRSTAASASSRRSARRLLAIIRKQRGEYERDLSPSWQRACRQCRSRA